MGNDGTCDGIPNGGCNCGTMLTNGTEVCKEVRRSLDVHGSNLGGIGGADSICAGDFGTGWKALLVGTSRRASVTPFVGDGQLDWVLRPNTYYFNEREQLVWQTDASALLGVRAAHPSRTARGERSMRTPPTEYPIARAHSVTERRAAQTKTLTPNTGPTMRVSRISISITTAPLNSTVVRSSQRARAPSRRSYRAGRFMVMRSRSAFGALAGVPPFEVELSAGALPARGEAPASARCEEAGGPTVSVARLSTERSETRITERSSRRPRRRGKTFLLGDGNGAR